MVGFYPNVYSITEAEEQVTVCVEVLNSFNGKHLHSFSVVLLPTSVFETSNAADDCYKELYFSTSESRKCHKYSIDNDNECQPTFFNIGLSIISTMGNRVQLQSNLSNATIFIDDSREPECYVTIGLSQTVYSVVEEEGVAVVCTSVLSGTTSGRTFSVSYQTVDGDAKAPGDYMPTNGNFDITDSNPEQCTSIAIISDNTTEVGDECFNYTISTNSTIFGFTVDPSSATICISDLNEVTSSLPQAASSQTVVIVAAVLGTLILSVIVGFVAVTVIISAYRKRTKERRNLESTSAREPHYSSLSEGRRADFLQHLREQLENKKMIYSKDQIQLSTTVGQGESGLVYKGYIRTAVGSDIVAVKTGKALSSTRDLKTLAKEVSTMLSFEHENVMSLIGVCIDGEMPLIIMPFMSNGSVLDYLKNRKDNLLVTGQFLKEEVELACKTLLWICLHIAKGMEYLSGQKFVHRDLAARNCMINGEGVIKVADFGLTEDMYNTNYIRRRKKSETEEKVPIRWMAVESIENCIYTEASDVIQCHGLLLETGIW
ncbi:Putative molluscan insulin-related peptide(s) receptor [Geodia barretti]|uniref:Molluscan insulin-related peptide(S) receptor n=2 Tax=Geodia barretti TaxID=519541 RepID=A0AA35R072_GEOBA|nr:Putative molluscan insulin-related peptide(s) receptor [Geodia barretti]